MGKNANVIVKSGRKLTDYEMLDEINTGLMHQLDDEAERCDELLGMLAVECDFIGQIAIGLYQEKHKQASKIKEKDVIRMIDTLLPFLTQEQKVAVKGSVEFHFDATRFNQRRPDLIPSWRDDHPVYLIDQMNFTHVINRYYGPEEIGQ